jgi:hypothetical protein
LCKSVAKRWSSGEFKAFLANIRTGRPASPPSLIKSGGKLEITQQIAAHESSRTTGLYDRRDDDANLDEVERIGI